MDSFHSLDRLSVIRVSEWKSHTQRLGQEGKGAVHRKALSVLSRVLRKQPTQADTHKPAKKWLELAAKVGIFVGGGAVLGTLG